MVFSKSFPRTAGEGTYPKGAEVFLTAEEEGDIEDRAREDNIKIMKECIDDAKTLIEEKGFKGFKEDILKVAVPLFEKRASHVVYWKEIKCREKFDELNK